MMKMTVWNALRASLCTLIIASAFCFNLLNANDPDWWAQRGFINTAAASDDTAAIFQGQLKHATVTAIEQLNALSPGGAGSSLGSLEQAWAASHPDALDGDVMNLGQLKFVSDKLFERLIFLGYDRPLTPGDPNTRPSVFRSQWQQLGVTEHKNIPNQGNLKYLFSFTFNTRLAGKHPDLDGDGVDNKKDADPFDYDINALSVQITYPQAGALLQP